MLEPREFWVLLAGAAVCLVLAVVNMVLLTGNRARQAEVNERAQFIQQSIQLEGLYRDMARALGDLAVRNNDNALRDLLAGEGFTLAPNPPAAAPTEQAP